MSKLPNNVFSVEFNDEKMPMLKKKTESVLNTTEKKTMYLVWTIVTVANETEDSRKDTIISMAEMQDNWQVAKKL